MRKNKNKILHHSGYAERKTERKNSWIHYTKFDDFHKVTLKHDKKKKYDSQKKNLLLKVLIETIAIKMLKKTARVHFI